MKARDYILVVSDGSEAIRIDFTCCAGNAEVRVLIKLCEREGGVLYMVVPARSVTRSILKAARTDSALVSKLPRRSFWRVGLVDDLVWRPVTADFQMGYGWNAFYVLKEPPPLEPIRDHYSQLKRIRGLLDDIACFQFDRARVLQLDGLLFLSVTSHDLESLTVVPVRRSLEEAKEMILSVMRDECDASGIEQQPFRLSNG